jgi:ERF superfamily
MNEITIAAPVPPTAITPAEPDSLLNFLARAVRDPAIDVTKLESLLRMQREIVADDARLQFNRAMSAAQGEMQPVLRNARNEQTSSRYATLEAVDAAIRPIYARHGFCLEFNSEPLDGPNVRIVCEVSHVGGHSKKYCLEAALDVAGPKGTGNKTPVQGLGSSVSYLRRYLTSMAFNVVLTNDDNDGNRTRPDAGRLSLEQLAVLSDLMAQTRTEEGRFLAAMTPGLTSIEHAPAADFPRLKNALLTKKGVLRQRWRLAVQQEDAAKAARNGAAQ